MRIWDAKSCVMGSTPTLPGADRGVLADAWQWSELAEKRHSDREIKREDVAKMTKDRALVGVMAVLVLLAFAAGCGLVSDQDRQEAKKKVEAKEQEVKKKVEAGQEDLKKKVDDLHKEVEVGQEDLEKKVDDLDEKLDDVEKKVDEVLKRVDAQEQQDQKEK